MFMDARGAVVAGADAEGDLAQFEVAEELVPFFRGEVAVLLAGALRAAAGDEGSVVGDDVLGVDRLWRRRISQLSEWLSAEAAPTLVSLVQPFMTGGSNGKPPGA